MSVIREIEQRRVSLYRVTATRRIRTLAAAARFVDRVGFCWLFAPSADVPELPSLFEAVKGRRGVHIENWDQDSDKVWGWKNELAAIKRAYYGKALIGRPAFISLELLPYLLALQGQDNFERLYASGGVSHDAKKIYDTLVRGGAMPTLTLRVTAGFSSKEESNRYHRALDELQRHLLVMPIGATAQGKAWPTQIFELVARWYPDQVARANQLDLSEARRTLVTRYLRTVYAAKPHALVRLFGLDPAQLSKLLEELTAARQARREGEWIIRMGR
ncbi:MAG: crosslink repair DNA glycosylase YcaQ family protein [Anaerolineae bacterium]